MQGEGDVAAASRLRGHFIYLRNRRTSGKSGRRKENVEKRRERNGKMEEGKNVSRISLGMKIMTIALMKISVFSDSNILIVRTCSTD